MCYVNVRPGLYYGNDLSRRHVGKGEVVIGGEANDITLSSHGFGAEQSRSERSVLVVWGVLLLLFHDGTVVVDEHECVVELGVVLAICSGV